VISKLSGYGGRHRSKNEVGRSCGAFITEKDELEEVL
jgi:hypothetical protein